MSSKEIVSNRKAFHSYEITEIFEAGIVLKGTEIKSLRDHGGSLTDSYVTVSRGEVWLIGAGIAPYKFGNINNHEERRPRKLLLHKYEISKIESFISRKGLAVVPLAILLKNGFAKVKIGCGKGKKSHDKRQAIIDRERKREAEAAMKYRSR
ncbi:SsrA-binding protein SmpB [Chlamydiifrater volucris]|uniref:SsrA-binding protein SmpB n=1 Tax=Chlamydiifrater volucris TaxID=2681470 RepID=UPI001BCC11E9|nr:SsrA-binding protein SmpB [Chlamydiifrater volucris]